MALLYAMYSGAIRAAFGGGWVFRLVVIQAIASAGSGVFSCDPGCPPAPVSMSGWLHMVGLVYFAATALLPFVAWRTFRGRSEFRSLRSVSFGMGVLLTVLFFIGPVVFGADRVGLWQRMFLIPAYAWQIVVALRVHDALNEASGAASDRQVRRAGGLAGPDPSADRIA
jgi:hypothetical protein